MGGEPEISLNSLSTARVKLASMRAASWHKVSRKVSLGNFQKVVSPPLS